MNIESDFTIITILVIIAIVEGGLIVVLTAFLLSTRSRIRRLQQDNRELLRRLRTLSRSKIVD